MFIHLGRKAGVFWVVRTRHPQFRDWLVACDQHFEMVGENHFEMVEGNHFEMVEGNHLERWWRETILRWWMKTILFLTKVLLCARDWTVLPTVLSSRLHRHLAKPKLGLCELTGARGWCHLFFLCT